MKKLIFFIFASLIFISCTTYSQDNQDTKQLSAKDMLCIKWKISDYKENGEKADMPEVYIEFKSDGKYVYKEEDTEEGIWEVSDDKTIIFDKGTDDEEKWDVNSLETQKLNVKYTEDKTEYECSFVPVPKN